MKAANHKPANGRTFYPGDEFAPSSIGKKNSQLASDAFPSPMQKAAYYGVAGEIVGALDPQTEADPAAVLIHLLTEVGSIIGRTVYSTAGGERHHANLFSALVGNTGKGRKGTAAAAVRHVTSQLDQDWRENRVLPGLSSGEGLKWAVRDPVYRDEAVKEKGRRTGETESVCVDPGVSDKRLLAIEPEFASVLQVMARERNTLSAALRQSWDGTRMSALTKNDPMTATDPHVSVIGHITREELRQLLSATDSANGFGNRFLWIAVKRSKFLPEGGDLQSVNLQEPLAWLRKVKAAVATFGEIHRNDEARELWASIYPVLSDARPGLFGSLTSRGEAQVLRLSMLYAVLEGARQVEVAHLQAALALWDYSERSAKWIFGTSTGNADADSILAALSKRGATGMTQTEINAEVFLRNAPAARIAAALEVLVHAGLAHCRANKNTGGAPSHRWFDGPERNETNELNEQRRDDAALASSNSLNSPPSGCEEVRA